MPFSKCLDNVLLLLAGGGDLCIQGFSLDDVYGRYYSHAVIGGVSKSPLTVTSGMTIGIVF